MKLLEQYLPRQGFLYRVDPRAKLITFTAVVAAIALTQPPSSILLVFYLVLLAVLAATARIPACHLIKRTAVTLPFVLPAVLFIPFLYSDGNLFLVRVGAMHLTVSQIGAELAASILARAWLSVMYISILMSTTDMSGILDGMERLKMPKIMVSLLGFTLRYLFVISDEAHRIKTGRDLRYYGGSVITGIRSLGHMAGSLFLRSYERADRVYGAMLLRGYNGTGRSLSRLSFTSTDAIFTICALLIVTGISLAGLWI